MWSKRGAAVKKNPIVVDGSNVAYLEKSKHGRPKVANILLVKKKLEEMGYEPFIIVDAKSRHEVDNAAELEKYISKGDILQAPAETDADYFIIEIAKRYSAKIVSNDQYSAYTEDKPWIDERRIPLMIIKGEVQFYKLEPAK